MKIYEGMNGEFVVVRSGDSGVWLGRMVAAEGSAVRLEDARRAWSWEGAGECAALAQLGPTGGNISVKTAVVVHGVCEVHKASEEAIAAWGAQPEWSGR